MVLHSPYCSGYSLPPYPPYQAHKAIYKGVIKDALRGRLFKLDYLHLFTKLRPFVKTFLKEASNFFEMYIYTLGETHHFITIAGIEKMIAP
ncbi:hypothetical protein RJ639_021973 [Escallonia herrerae]|uniref:protein-serine/threonine phosphatase n=1 Tax=Escallonia herrerae TaxID=1293975 RepID=A0AA89AG34_9ASTE|nr:hypothetical protein RJ639_021973 [Escallonia herrerae]